MKDVIRTVLIPEIEKEINQGKHFVQLRQIYDAMILATWYKVRLKESLLGKIYVDQNKTDGVTQEDPATNEKIWDQYVQSFKTGVFDLIQEDYDPTTQTIVPRKYFSGGVTFKSNRGSLAKIMTFVTGITLFAFMNQVQGAIKPSNFVQISVLASRS